MVSAERWGFAFLHHVEMGVEAGNLVDFRLPHAHFLGQCTDVCRGNVTKSILHQMQELDQQIAVARAVAQQIENLGMGLIVKLTALGGLAPLAASRFPNARCVVQGCHGCLPTQVPETAITPSFPMVKFECPKAR